MTHPEPKLAESMRNYLNSSNEAFDPKFRAALEALMPTQQNCSAPSKQQILDFIQQHGRRPSPRAADTQEQGLGRRLTSYTSPSHKSFDPDFTEQLGWVRREDSRAALKVQILDFCRNHGRRPDPRQPQEKQLRQQMDRYRQRDPEFAAEVERLCPLDTRKSHPKEMK